MSFDLEYAMFLQQRLQILSIGVAQKEFSLPYLYAWSESLYPVTYDSDGHTDRRPHELYEEQFRISKDAVDSVIKFCDDRWQAGNLPTFDEVDDNLPEIGSSSLKTIFRFLYMQDAFDDGFWDKLLEKGRHPGTANSIRIEIDRDMLLYNLGY